MTASKPLLYRFKYGDCWTPRKALHTLTHKFHKAFQVLIAFTGALVCFYSAYRVLEFPTDVPSFNVNSLNEFVARTSLAARAENIVPFDYSFLLLAVMTVAVASRISIQIPYSDGYITVSDTLIFLTILLYGGEAAILLATAEGLFGSYSFLKKTKKLTRLMNAGSMACSTFASVWSLRILFGSISSLATGGYTPRFLTALLVMAFVQYFVNSALIAIHASFKNNASLVETWFRYYLWASITYLAGAFAAGIAAQTVVAYGFYAFNAIIFAAPIILIIYLTYRTYLKNVEASAAAAQAAEAQRHFEERERILEQYAQVEKLSALGELASGVAHNFNNTLAGILGRAQMLQQSTDLEEVRRGLDIIVRVTEDGAQTVKRIQDFARQRRDHDFVPLAVDQVLFDISEITRPRWKNSAEANDIHINLELEIASQATVMGDASELREVLVNLVFNAVDAMPEGGKLRLATKEVDGFVHISVSDTGSGMSEETRTRVFDPFFTTKGKAGLGLGLAVSYGIIRRHEGIFEVDSEIGRGTTFSIKLPIARDVKPNPALPILTPSVSSSGGFERAKILVIDDEEYVRELLRDVLEAEGCRVVTAGDGLEALSLFEGTRIAGVFTDVGLPGMSGWELARELRLRSPALPIAIITGWGDSIGTDKQRAAGIEWIVTKPFSVERIVTIARSIATSYDITNNANTSNQLDQDQSTSGIIN